MKKTKSKVASIIFIVIMALFKILRGSKEQTQNVKRLLNDGKIKNLHDLLLCLGTDDEIIKNTLK